MNLERTSPAGRGLGRHGWVSSALPARTRAARWTPVEGWTRTSFGRVVPGEDGTA